MGFFGLIAIVAAICFYKWYMSPNAVAVRKLCEGKTGDQKKVINYFLREGCLTGKISDDEYIKMVHAKRDSMNFRQKAIDKVGLDEDEIKEIPPAEFKGFVYNNAFAKKTANGDWVSSSYQVSWIFFSSTQIYLYFYTFNMDDDNKFEVTQEFFYKDITSFTTTSETETAKEYKNKDVSKDLQVTTNKFAVVVPGDKLYMSMGDAGDSENTIQAMKQKLREKKNA